MGSVFLFCALLALVWLIFAATMKNPRYLTTRLLRVGEMDAASARLLSQKMTAVQGVAEAVVIGSDGVAYLKVDQHALDEDALTEFALDAAGHCSNTGV
jgi:hypothetical protein